MHTIRFERTHPEGYRFLRPARLPDFATCAGANGGIRTRKTRSFEPQRSTSCHHVRMNDTIRTTIRTPRNERTPRAFRLEGSSEESVCGRLQTSPLRAARKQRRIGKQAGAGPQGNHRSVVALTLNGVNRFPARFSRQRSLALFRAAIFAGDSAASASASATRVRIVYVSMQLCDRG